eukprot:UN13079
MVVVDVGFFENICLTSKIIITNGLGFLAPWLDFEHTYVLPSKIIITMLGITYFLGFKVAHDQNVGLIGQNGIT